MNWKKHAILAALVGMLFTVAPTFGQSKSEGTKPERGNVLLRFIKDGTVSASCSQTIGLITQSMLQIEGVTNVKMDPKNNGVQVSYDSRKTTPQKIVVAFNQENPDTLLQLPDTGRRKWRYGAVQKWTLTLGRKRMFVLQRDSMVAWQSRYP